MKSIGKTEIPNVGTYLYAEAWAEGKIGGTGSNQRLPEYDGSDSEASVLRANYFRENFSSERV